MGGTHPNPSHAWGQGSLESFQPRRSCLGRNTEVSPLMCAGKTHLASSQRQGSQSLASSAALMGTAASPTGPQHVEPEPAPPRWVISTARLRSRGPAVATWLTGRWPCTVPEAQIPTGAVSPHTGTRSRPLARAVGGSTRSSSTERGAGEAGREQPGGAGGSSRFKVAFFPKIACG